LDLAKNLRELRTLKGNKQTELADYLGISVQSVSKWERNEGMPGIDLLPSIAFYYNTTVDHLLGCDIKKIEKEIDDFENKIGKLSTEGKTKDILSICIEMNKKYPNNQIILYYLMNSLYSVDCVSNSKQIIDIAERMLSNSNIVYRYSAIQILAFTYSKIGFYDKAKEYANMIPNNRDILVHILKGNELVLHCRSYFWSICDNMVKMMSYMINCIESKYTAEERYNMAKGLYDFYFVIFADEDFGFWDERLGRLCYIMASNLSTMGNKTEAIRVLEKMFEHFRKYKIFNSIEHTSPFVRGIYFDKDQISKNNETDVIDQYIMNISKDKNFDVMREDISFLNIIKATADDI